MAPVLYRLGRFCVRHPWLVVLVWAVVVVGAVVAITGVGQETNDNLTLPGTDSQAATDLLSDKFPKQANGSVPIVFRAPSGDKLTDSRYEKPIKNVTKAYAKDPAISKAVGPFDEQGEAQLNKKKTIGFISLNIKDGAF